MKSSRINWGIGPLVIAAAVIVASCESPTTVTPSASSPSAPGTDSPGKAKPPEVKKFDRVPSQSVPESDKMIPEPPVEVPALEKKPKGEVTQMDIGTLFQLQEDGRAFVVDVRPGFFYAIKHIPGAISMPKKNFEAEFPAKQAQFDAAVAAKKPVVLYCADSNCPDARGAAKILSKKGYSSAVFSGGWKEWNESGLGE